LAKQNIFFELRSDWEKADFWTPKWSYKCRYI